MDLTPELKTAFPDGTNRFNDGTCDPAGRFFAGTMGFKIGEFNGTLFELSLSSGSTLEGLQSSNGPLDVRTVLKNVTCTNGMAWTKDQKHVRVFVFPGHKHRRLADNGSSFQVLYRQLDKDHLQIRL
jgi:sugar lactone lactonase YvrE